MTGDWDTGGIQGINARAFLSAREKDEQEECQGTMGVNLAQEGLIARQVREFLAQPQVYHAVEGFPGPLVGPEPEEGQSENF